ncbi:MAG: hypothetical protein V3T59_01875, partial [Desulfobacterales bacterium]
RRNWTKGGVLQRSRCLSPEHSEVEFFNFSAASRRTLQIVPTMNSEVQTLVNRNIFMTTGIEHNRGCKEKQP